MLMYQNKFIGYQRDFYNNQLLISIIFVFKY
jgi:hypothetical protein